MCVAQAEKRGGFVTTDQELRKLKRHELLEMMIHQGKAMARQQEQLDAAKQHAEEAEAELAQMTETYERLRKKLDDKDARIAELREELAKADEEHAAELAQMNETYERLRKKLDDKDAKIRVLEDQLALDGGADPEQQQTAAAMRDAVARFNQVVELAQKTAELHLDVIRELGERA